MVEGIIQFVTTHSEALIAGSFSVILILSGVLIYFNVFVAKPADAEADFKKIEESIEKLLTKAEFIKGGAGSAAASASAGGETGEAGEVSEAGDGVSSTDILELEAELAEKKREIEKLKEDLQAGGGGDDNTPELLSKIKNLEDRLAEYEIIEDDIADLSHYKEENERLKKQLAEGGVSSPEAAAESVPAAEEPPAEEVVAATVAEEPEFPVQAQADSGEDAEVAAALASLDDDEGTEEDAAGEAPASEPAKDEAVPAEESPAVEEVVAETKQEPAPEESNPEMDEFSKAVEDLEAQKEAEAESKPVEEVAKEESDEPVGSDDVFAEMSDSGEASEDPLAALGDIDTNKMLEELQGLEADASAGADVLEEQADVDKMATEAESLEKKS